MASRRKRSVSRSAKTFLHRAWTTAEQIRELERYMPLARIARETGIPLKTLKRFRAGDEPRTDLEANYAGYLDSGFDELRKELVREESRANRTLPPGKPVRTKRIDPMDTRQKRRIPSDSVDRYIANSSIDSVIGILLRAADRARRLNIHGRARFLILADSTSPDYPDEYFWSEAEALRELSDVMIASWVEDIFTLGEPIIVRIQDQ